MERMLKINKMIIMSIILSNPTKNKIKIHAIKLSKIIRFVDLYILWSFLSIHNY